MSRPRQAQQDESEKQPDPAGLAATPHAPVIL